MFYLCIWTFPALWTMLILQKMVQLKSLLLNKIFSNVEMQKHQENIVLL